MTQNDTPIHDAATIVLARQGPDGLRVLMGQRGKTAVFMPNKFVFPGGRVDAEDHDVSLSLPQSLRDKLENRASAGMANALVAAAIRELWEETGLRLHDNHKTDARNLRFFFRAITPIGRPRRFDARFFLVPADAIAGDLDDFSEASDELSHLQWVSLTQARALELPFITRIVLSEVEAMVTRPDVSRDVPFFHHDAERSYFSVL